MLQRYCAHFAFRVALCLLFHIWLRHATGCRVIFCFDYLSCWRQGGKGLGIGVVRRGGSFVVLYTLVYLGLRFQSAMMTTRVIIKDKRVYNVQTHIQEQ